MKNLIFVLFIFSSLLTLAQNISELLYVKINKYRKDHNLNELVVSDKAKVANTQQLNYMVKTSTVPLDHSQKIKTIFPKTFSTFTERMDYVYQNDYYYVGENLIAFFYEGSDERIAEKIFTSWVNSYSHNEVLLSNKPTGFYINYQITTKLITPTTEFEGAKIIYCVLTTYK